MNVDVDAVRDWTKQTRMAREMYFAEQDWLTNGGRETFNVSICRARFCSEESRSITQLCKKHRALLGLS